MEGWFLPEPSAAAELGSPGPKVVVSSRKSQLVSGKAVEVIPVPASAVQRNLLHPCCGAEEANQGHSRERGCSRLLAAGHSLMCCSNRTSLSLGRSEALLLQRPLCLHLLGPGTPQEGLLLLPEGCSDSVMHGRVGDVQLWAAGNWCCLGWSS